jgi:hypothetical protein
MYQIGKAVSSVVTPFATKEGPEDSIGKPSRLRPNESIASNEN